MAVSRLNNVVFSVTVIVTTLLLIDIELTQSTSGVMYSVHNPPLGLFMMVKLAEPPSLLNVNDVGNILTVAIFNHYCLLKNIKTTPCVFI